MRRFFTSAVKPRLIQTQLQLTIIIGADEETPALARRNALLQRKDARGQRPDALCVKDARRGGGSTREGQLDGEAVARDAGVGIEAGKGAGVGDGGGGGGDVAEGRLDEDAAGEEGDVAGCEIDGLDDDDGVSRLDFFV